MSFPPPVRGGSHPVDPSLTYGNAGANVRAARTPVSTTTQVATQVIPASDGMHVAVGQRSGAAVPLPHSTVAYVAPQQQLHHHVPGGANPRGNALQSGARVPTNERR